MVCLGQSVVVAAVRCWAISSYPDATSFLIRKIILTDSTVRNSGKSLECVFLTHTHSALPLEPVALALQLDIVY